MQAQILVPAALLACWSLVMLFWMGKARLDAMMRMGGRLTRAKPGMPGQDLQGVVADEVNWKSHNYTLLMEQPTLFYAVVAILAIVGASRLDVVLAWSYVILRIIHSVYQSTRNRLPVRFAIFAVSTICLALLALHALGIAVAAAYFDA